MVDDRVKAPLNERASFSPGNPGGRCREGRLGLAFSETLVAWEMEPMTSPDPARLRDRDPSFLY